MNLMSIATDKAIIMTDGYKVEHPIIKTEAELHSIYIEKFDYPFHGSYNWNVKIAEVLFNQFFKIAQADLEETPFINLVFRGTSGCFLAGIFNQMFSKETKFFVDDSSKKINMCLIRKPEENSHSQCHSDFDKRGLTIWVDDFIDSGETLEKCWQDFLIDFEDFKFDWIVTSYTFPSGLSSVNKCANKIVTAGIETLLV